VAAGKSQDPRISLLLVINNQEHGEGFKKSNILREFPAVVGKHVGPFPFEIRDSENKRRGMEELTDGQRYIVRETEEEKITIEGIEQPIAIPFGSGRLIHAEIQRQTNIDRSIILIYQEGRRVPLPRLSENETYHVAINEDIWDQFPPFGALFAAGAAPCHGEARCGRRSHIDARGSQGDSR
jgi:hypothetical protein